MDETTDEELKDTFADLMIFSKGGLTYKELSEMTIYDLQEWVEVANRVYTKIKKEIG